MALRVDRRGKITHPFTQGYRTIAGLTVEKNGISDFDVKAGQTDIVAFA